MAAGEHDFSQYIGMPTGRGTIVVERAPVSQFAKAILDENPVYQNAAVAEANGFAGIPAPPTYGFIAQSWGKWAELQPAPDPDARQPMMEVMGGLMSKGGLVLHGEQEFVYHRPMVVGETLDFVGTVTDIYEKPTGDRTMTFMVVEDVYSDSDGEPVLTSIMNLIHRS
jgi:acyl dehydratase